jgi:ubiquinone/menaquinone biosynthesis C-methylase UbiE
MTASISLAKPYKGMGMEGAVARWYASLTKKSLDEFTTLARRSATTLPAGSSVLEVAPGPGYFSIELAKTGNYRIAGIDISKTFVDIARANAAEAGAVIDFRQGDVARMPFRGNSFDFLLCRAAFKNFTKPERALEEMHRVLKPGGTALIIDLRRDASMDSIRQAVRKMNTGVMNSFITRMTFRFMLLPRAYTKADFEQMIARTKFDRSEIREDLIGLEISLTK